LSSTMRMRWPIWLPRAAAQRARLLGQEIDETLDRVELALGLRIELRGEDRRGGVAAQHVEQLVIERREAVLLREQPVDRDRADRRVLQDERNAYDRLREIVGALGVPARGLVRRDGLAEHAHAELRLRKRRQLHAFGRDRQELRALAVDQVDREHVRAD